MLLSMLFWIRRLHTALQTQPLTVDPAISGGESFYRVQQAVDEIIFG